MPSVKKIIEKMENQPNSISPQEATKVLESCGYYSLRQKGSHHSFRNAAGEVIVIAEHKPLKRVYVENILEIVGGNK
jgi:predicted RNA binding protein YcfA (HicA-like mRNA interferase family)